MIEVKVIKTMREEECFSYTKSGLFFSKIMEFLKKNNKFAYTGKEIKDELNKLNVKSPNLYNPEIKLSTITSALSKAKKYKKLLT